MPASGEIPWDTLSPRQRDIITLVCKGLSDKEVAARLGLGSGTVAEHLKIMFRRLEIHSRVELAYEFGRQVAGKEMKKWTTAP